MKTVTRVQVIDSHTGGEPTRVVISGGPDLGGGTGTNAKLACLHADGKLREGEVWRQENIVGSIFEGSYSIVGGRLYPKVKGSAFVNAETTLILDENDPFCWGIR